MKTVIFTYLGAKCEYNFETRNLHIISKHSFNSPNQPYRNVISKKHNIEKQDIKSITFKYNNTKLPEQLYNYFTNYTNLEHIELEKLDFKDVIVINKFIEYCPRLKEINITHKNAENLTSIENFINDTKNTKSITIKHINAPNLKKVEWLLWYIEKDIQEITIENITAPNIKTVHYLLYEIPIKTLNLTKIGDVSVESITTLIANCDKLKTLKLNLLTNTKEIGVFIKRTPALKTEIISKINKVKTLNPYFLTITPKTETLDLDKFEDISKLSSHLKESVFNDSIYPSIKIGRHQISFTDYLIILENNIPIVDKTEEEIVKEIIKQSKNETKENIEIFLTALENKKTFKNEEYEKQLKSKLTIIKNLK